MPWGGLDTGLFVHPRLAARRTLESLESLAKLERYAFRGLKVTRGLYVCAPLCVAEPGGTRTQLVGCSCVAKALTNIAIFGLVCGPHQVFTKQSEAHEHRVGRLCRLDDIPDVCGCRAVPHAAAYWSLFPNAGADVMRVCFDPGVGVCRAHISRGIRVFLRDRRLELGTNFPRLVGGVLSGLSASGTV